MERINFVSPVGRLVAGSVSEPNTTDQQGNPLLTKSGPNQGKPRVEYFFAIACEKGTPDAEAFRALLGRAAQQAWPGGQYQSPNFSWKFDDGDGIDSNGKPFAEREGYKGCWVFKFSGGYAPRVYKPANGGHQPMDPTEVYKGCYIRVSGNIASNQNTQKPGLYVNHDMIEFIGHGTPIFTGPDASTVFSQAATHVPAGVSATPVGTPAPGAAPAAPGGHNYAPPAPGAAPTGGFGPGSTPPPAPGSTPPPAPAPAPAPAAPAGPQRPTDPSFIHAAGTPDEQWYVNGAWMPAPKQAAPAPAPAPTPTPPPAPAPAAPAGPQRPTDPSFIHAAGTPQEQWYVNGAWMPAPAGNGPNHSFLQP